MLVRNSAYDGVFPTGVGDLNYPARAEPRVFGLHHADAAKAGRHVALMRVSNLGAGWHEAVAGLKATGDGD